jgi:hypothetical protein
LSGDPWSDFLVQVRGSPLAIKVLTDHHVAAGPPQGVERALQVIALDLIDRQVTVLRLHSFRLRF